MTKARRRSGSSSSSSSGDEHRHEYKQHKDKKHGKKHGETQRTSAIPPYPAPAAAISSSHHTNMSSPPYPAYPSPSGAPPSYAPPPGPPPSFPAASATFERDRSAPGFPQHSPSGDQSQTSFNSPSQPPRSTPPPSGFRVPLTVSQAFPGVAESGQPVAYDLDGRSPIFMGSALLEKSVHPCKIAPALQPVARVPYGGTEYEHQGRYDLLPFDPNTMEWVPAEGGRLPNGRRPVEGGYEENGAKLYHALAVVNGVKVPGKVGEHLVRDSAMRLGVPHFG